jgi:hypothetical protein
MNFVLTLALTDVFSPRRGFYPSRFLVICSPIRQIQSREFSEKRRAILPLLGARSGVSAERRHFEFGQRRSADSPLRSKSLWLTGVRAQRR